MNEQTLQRTIEASPYLSHLQSQHEFVVSVPAPQPLTQHIGTLYQRIVDYDFVGQGDVEAAAAFLKHIKAEFVFAWSQAELSRAVPQQQLGQWQTRFAELTIDFALRIAWLKEASKNAALATQLKNNDHQMLGLFIFGMGKLGGQDLNFSSDVDLVAYFNPDVLPVPDMLGKSYICHRVLQTMTGLLNQQGGPNFIWRVDWRLRPDASATSLAMSTQAAHDYYFYRASSWHRLALMKARVIAGDYSTGEAFLQSLMPFIWRQNLDFRALDELAEIKQRINLEHPSLKAQRQWREPITDQIDGFNVKLGSGGIREIEFIVNALQLIWGGKQYALRIANTLDALAVLAELELLDAQAATELKAAYLLLRRVENAIQLLGNQQTHLIPNNQDNQQRLLTLLAISDWQALVAELNQHRRLVNEHFSHLFNYENENDTIGDDIVWPDDLNAAAEEIVSAWEEGMLVYGVPMSMRDKLQPLIKHLASLFATPDQQQNDQQPNSELVLRLHDFFRSLPQGGQYFRLLAESPKLLSSLIPPLLFSPPMITLLTQSPHIIDCFMEPEHDFIAQGFDSEYVFMAEQYEIRLNRLRRFVNENLYQLYLQFMQGQLDVQPFQKILTELAVHTLQCSLRLVTEQMQLAQSPISIIGMGKVATGRMSPLSDLDLIFVFDQDQVEMDVAAKFVTRLQTAISTPMREGIVYELDTRLRPSGRSGAPTVSIDSFHKHHLNRAHTWEHIALVPSRVLVGEEHIDQAVTQVKQQVLTKPRNSKQLLNDAIKMWHRIEQHRIEPRSYDILYSKLRPGGLMQAEYLAACLILQNTADIQGLDINNYDALLAKACANSMIKELPEVIQFWRIQQLWARLLGKVDQPIASIPDVYLQRLLQQSGVNSVAELSDKKQAMAERVINAMTQLFQDSPMTEAEIEQWHEQAVQWG